MRDFHRLAEPGFWSLNFPSRWYVIVSRLRNESVSIIRIRIRAHGSRGQKPSAGRIARRAATAVPPNAPTVLYFAPHPDDETIIGGLALASCAKPGGR